MGSSLTSSSLEETKTFASQLAERLSPGDVVCLHGDLGAGKTTTAKSLITALTKSTSEDDVTSPTFITMNLYNHVAHFDLYRLKKKEEFIMGGFEEYLEEPYITIIEWPDVIEDLLPKSAIHIHIEVLPEGGRKFHEAV